jgi:hypothetical protein
MCHKPTNFNVSQANKLQCVRRCEHLARYAVFHTLDDIYHSSSHSLQYFCVAVFKLFMQYVSVENSTLYSDPIRKQYLEQPDSFRLGSCRLRGETIFHAVILPERNLIL